MTKPLLLAGAMVFCGRDGLFRGRALLGCQQSRHQQMRDRHQQADCDRQYLVRGRAISIARWCQACPLDHWRVPGERSVCGL